MLLLNLLVNFKVQKLLMMTSFRNMNYFTKSSLRVSQLLTKEFKKIDNKEIIS